MCNDKSGVADGGEGKDQGAWGEVRLTRIYRFSGWPSPMHSGYNDIWPSRFDKDMCKIYTIQCTGTVGKDLRFLRVASDVQCTMKTRIDQDRIHTQNANKVGPMLTKLFPKKMHEQMHT